MIQMVRQITLLLLISLTICHIQLELTRYPRSQKAFPLTKSECQDPKTIGNECRYQQICYQKDIAYTVAFSQHPATFRLALDLTTPISWIKNSNCHIITTKQKCTLLDQNIAQRINSALRHKVTQLVKKLRIKIADEQEDKAIIEGSNQIVMGTVEPLTQYSLEGKNTQHVSQWMDMLLLGLYIIGEKDNITLKSATFMKAHEISPNLDGLEDGAISMRFDENAQSSFLNELFQYSGSKKKIVSVYLGDHEQLVTIGDYEKKFMREGIQSLRRIKLEQDQKLGKLAQIQAILVQNIDIEDGSIQDNSTVVFTLSSSYISFPKTVIDAFIQKFFKNPQTCKLVPYLQCSFKNKEQLNVFIGSNLNLDFDTSVVSFGLDELVLKRQSRKVKFNIKQSQNSFIILGEPFFLKYYAYFDYDKNQIGYTERALSIEESLIGMVTLIHLVVLVFLFSCCMVLSSDKLRSFYYRMFERMMGRAQPALNRLRTAYRPVGGEVAEENRQVHAPSLGQDVEGL